MNLEDFLKEAAPVRLAIRSSGNSQAHAVETLLDISARHASAARFGVRLYSNSSVTGDVVDGATPSIRRPRQENGKRFV
jgi:hypothetical protein